MRRHAHVAKFLPLSASGFYVSAFTPASLCFEITCLYTVPQLPLQQLVPFIFPAKVGETCLRPSCRTLLICYSLRRQVNAWKSARPLRIFRLLPRSPSAVSSTPSHRSCWPCTAPALPTSTSRRKTSSCTPTRHPYRLRRAAPALQPQRGPKRDT